MSLLSPKFLISKNEMKVANKIWAISKLFWAKGPNFGDEVVVCPVGLLAIKAVFPRIVKTSIHNCG